MNAIIGLRNGLLIELVFGLLCYAIYGWVTG